MNKGIAVFQAGDEVFDNKWGVNYELMVIEAIDATAKMYPIRVKCVRKEGSYEYLSYTADGRLWSTNAPTLFLKEHVTAVEIQATAEGTWVHKDLPPAVQRTDDINIAIERLGKFIERKANEWSRILGVSYEESDEHVYDTFEDAKRNVQEALALKHPVYVMKSATDKSLYEKPYIVWALRFWHEVLHYVLNADFSEAGEFKVSLAHIRDVEAEFGKGSLEAKLMHAETLGQVSYYWVHGEFVDDQKAFDLNYIKQY